MESPTTAIDALGRSGATGAVGAADWQAASRKSARAAKSTGMRSMVVSKAGLGIGSGV
jgi:hypothetical protein